MSEALAQALIRLVVGSVSAGLLFIAANLTVLSGAIDDPILAGLVLSIGPGVISAILKYIGGPTEAADRQVGRGLGGPAKRPNPFAV